MCFREGARPPAIFIVEVIHMEEILQGIANVGFPIVVAAYLLVRIEGKLE